MGLKVGVGEWCQLMREGGLVEGVIEKGEGRGGERLEIRY